MHGIGQEGFYSWMLFQMSMLICLSIRGFLYSTCLWNRGSSYNGDDITTSLKWWHMCISTVLYLHMFITYIYTHACVHVNTASYSFHPLNSVTLIGWSLAIVDIYQKCCTVGLKLELHGCKLNLTTQPYLFLFLRCRYSCEKMFTHICTYVCESISI